MADDLTPKELGCWQQRCKVYIDSCFYNADKLCIKHSLHPVRKYKIIRLGDETSDWKAQRSPVHKDISKAVIVTKHQEFTKIWRESAFYQVVYQAIEESVFQQTKLAITTCMCSGLGSFTGVCPKGANSRDDSLQQLVAFEGWVEQLSTVSPLLLEMTVSHFFQEPNLTLNTSTSKSLDSTIWMRSFFNLKVMRSYLLQNPIIK